QVLAKLRGEGASDANAPGGRYPDSSKLRMIVGHDGLVKRISFIFQQPYCRAGLPNCPQSGSPSNPHRTITWSVRYSQVSDDHHVLGEASGHGERLGERADEEIPRVEGRADDDMAAIELTGDQAAV